MLAPSEYVVDDVVDRRAVGRGLAAAEEGDELQARLAVVAGVVERDLAGRLAEAQARVDEEDIAPLGVGGPSLAKSSLLPPKPLVARIAGAGWALETPSGV